MLRALGIGDFRLLWPQTVVQRAIPNSTPGRVSAVFLTTEALATLLGALLGPAIAEVTGLTTTATVASASTLIAAALACLLPRLPPSATTSG